jgi:hypothetical protein
MNTADFIITSTYQEVKSLSYLSPDLRTCQLNLSGCPQGQSSSRSLGGTLTCLCFGPSVVNLNLQDLRCVALSAIGCLPCLDIFTIMQALYCPLIVAWELIVSVICRSLGRQTRLGSMSHMPTSQCRTFTESFMASMFSTQSSTSFPQVGPCLRVCIDVVELLLGLRAMHLL